MSRIVVLGRNVFESVIRALPILYKTTNVKHTSIHLTFVLSSSTVPTAYEKMFRSLKEGPQGILSMLNMRINRTAPEPGILAMTIHTRSTGKESENFKPTGYVSASRGESVCSLAIPSLLLRRLSNPIAHTIATSHRLYPRTSIHHLLVTCPCRLGTYTSPDIAADLRRNLEEACMLSMYGLVH